jgi:hypothetical protein
MTSEVIVRIQPVAKAGALTQRTKACAIAYLRNLRVGADLALHVVERELGADVADGIAGGMEYTRDRDVYISAD